MVSDPKDAISSRSRRAAPSVEFEPSLSEGARFDRPRRRSAREKIPKRSRTVPPRPTVSPKPPHRRGTHPPRDFGSSPNEPGRGMYGRRLEVRPCCPRGHSFGTALRIGKVRPLSPLKLAGPGEFIRPGRLCGHIRRCRVAATCPACRPQTATAPTSLARRVFRGGERGANRSEAVGPIGGTAEDAERDGSRDDR